MRPHAGPRSSAVAALVVLQAILLVSSLMLLTGATLAESAQDSDASSGGAQAAGVEPVQAEPELKLLTHPKKLKLVSGGVRKTVEAWTCPADAKPPFGEDGEPGNRDDDCNNVKAYWSSGDKGATSLSHHRAVKTRVSLLTSADTTVIAKRGKYEAEVKIIAKPAPVQVQAKAAKPASKAPKASQPKAAKPAAPECDIDPFSGNCIAEAAFAAPKASQPKAAKASQPKAAKASQPKAAKPAAPECDIDPFSGNCIAEAAVAAPKDKSGVRIAAKKPWQPGPYEVPNGTVHDGTLTVKGGTVVVRGTVTGDVVQTGPGDLIVAATGRVEGDALEKGDGLLRVDGTVLGNVEQRGDGGIVVNGLVEGNATSKGGEDGISVNGVVLGDIHATGGGDGTAAVLELTGPPAYSWPTGVWEVSERYDLRLSTGAPVPHPIDFTFEQVAGAPLHGTIELVARDTSSGPAVLIAHQGIYTLPGVQSWVLTATDALGRTTSLPIAIDVVPVALDLVTDDALTAKQAELASWSFEATSSEYPSRDAGLGNWAISWADDPGGLEITCRGDLFDYCSLSGEPRRSGTFGFHLAVDEEHTGLSASGDFELVVEPNLFVRSPLERGKVEGFYLDTLEVVTGDGGWVSWDWTWEVTDLPAGLAFDPPASIQGSPTEPGTHTFTADGRRRDCDR